jgi:putative transcriptional regulator
MQTLQHHFLIAMPSLQDPFFHRSVTYICEHNAEGAMGIVINHPLKATVGDLLEQLDIKFDSSNKIIEQEVCAGGPVHADRGFVLHSARPGYQSSLELADELMITTSKDILQQLTSKEAPRKFLLALGYAGWTQGQLEQEIADNSWLVIPADPAIIFDMAHDVKWEAATRTMGIESWQLSNDVGRA